MEEKILTLHPQGKTGVNISKAKYDLIHETIEAFLKENEEMTFTELGEMVKRGLEGSFEGSVIWYYTTVKLDMEARGRLERIPGSKPQKIRLS